MSEKKGLREFQEVYDMAGEMGLLALDLAQNLSFKYEIAKPEYAKISEEDVHLAYGITGMGSKYPLPLMSAVHKLAKALGYTREDYIENSDKRRGKGNVNIYVAGVGSINCDTKDLMEEKDGKNNSNK